MQTLDSGHRPRLCLVNISGSVYTDWHIPNIERISKLSKQKFLKKNKTKLTFLYIKNISLYSTLRK